MLITCVVYLPVRHHGFINYDDQEYITANSVVQQGLTADGLRWAFSGVHAANWHPITWLSHMLDCELFGLAPAGHHLMNVALHAANAVLLFLLLQYLTGSIGRSALVAALFALHPLHVESVAWVAERKDLLSTLFGLMALGAYALYAKREVRRRFFWIACYSSALLLFALSLMSKPMMVTLPFLLILLDYWPLQRLRFDGSLPKHHGRLLIEKAPFLALTIISSVVTMHAQKSGMMYFANLTFSERAANAVVAIPRYLGKTFWPQDLAILYPHPVHWPAWQVWGSALAVVAMSLFVLKLGRRKPCLPVGWFWFLGMLVPVLGLVQVGVQSMADRYTYLPLVGVFIMAVWAVADSRIAGRVPVAIRVACPVLLIIACSLITRWQLRVWADTESIFTHAIRVTRDNWVAHSNLSLLAMQRYQDLQRSTVEQQTLDPARFSGKSANRDYLAEVIYHCEIVTRIKPGFPEVRVTFAKALTEKGQFAAARLQLEAAIKLSPDNAEARQNLAEIYLRQKQIKPAIAEYKRALELKPDWPPVLNNLAWFLATHPDAGIRDGAGAVQLALRACDLTSRTNIWFLQTLAAAYAEAGEFTNATVTAEKALTLATDSGLVPLVDTFRQRLELYRTGKPLRDSASPK